MGHWESTYGRGANYILNLPPSANGLIEPALVAAARAFRAERTRRYGPAALLASAQGSVSAATAADGGNTLVLQLPGDGHVVDRILLAETALATLGQQVLRYTLEAQLAGAGDEWVALRLSDNPTACQLHAYTHCGGETIGTHHLDAGWAQTAPLAAVRLTLLQTLSPGARPQISMKAYCVGCQ